MIFELTRKKLYIIDIITIEISENKIFKKFVKFFKNVWKYLIIFNKYF